MEAAEENGGSVTVDLNENEEEAGGGAALKARSRALLAGVGGPARRRGEAGSVEPELHGGLNGFTEPVGLELGGLDLGGPGRGSGAIQGAPRDSYSAAPGEEAAGGGRAGNPQLGCGGSQAALPDANMPNGVVDSPERDPGGFYHPSAPDHKLSGCEEVKIANGGLHIRASCDSLGEDAGSPGGDSGCSGGDAGCPEEDAGCPGRDAGCSGGDAGCPEEDAGCPGGDAGRLEEDAGCPGGDAGCPRGDAGCPGGDAGCPEEDAGCPEEDAGRLEGDAGCPGWDVGFPGMDAGCPRGDIKLLVSIGPSTEDPLTWGSSANPPSPCLSTHSDPASDSPLSELDTREDEEDDEDGDLRDLSLPVRPQSLRTNPNLTVSLSCDATPLSPDEDGGFYFGVAGYEEDIRVMLEVGRRQSAPDNLPDLSDQADDSDPKLMPKRFGIADFFTRSLFARKAKEPRAAAHNAAGWRLFGKTAIRDGEQAKEPASPVTSQSPQPEPETDPSCPQRPPAAGRRKNLEFEPLSTTALILEDRPSNLPAKSVEETQRHKLEYEEMVAGAKRRELKEAQRKKRQMKERHRQEDIISNAMVIWNTEILPHWDSMKSTRRVRDLWWQGLPPSVRGRVWSLAIGNELNITAELYEIFLSRAKEKWRSYSETSSVNDSESDGGASLADRESSLDLIKLDISRTFPSLFIFQKGGPYHDLLHSVLGAYTCYRPDIGYVQGMSFIAAVLILNLEEAEAFITFANLLNKPCQMAFFRVDHELMLKYFAAFEIFFEENLPRLFSHFQTNNLTPDLYLIDWIFTLYSKSLPLDVACRVWDVFCRDGEESLFRTGLGVLRLFQDVLLQMDFIHIAQFLTRLPDDLQAHTLFNAMANTHMISRNRRWAQVFTALMKDGCREAEKSSSSPALRS